MTARVVVTFKDIRAKKLRKAGEEFKCSEERFAEILQKGKYVERVESAESKPAKSRKKVKKEVDEGL